YYPSQTQLYPSHISTFRNRIAFTGINGTPSIVRLSGEGNEQDWDLWIPGQSTTSAQIQISGLQDGIAINGFLGQYQNALYIGRPNDLWALSGNDRRDFTLRQVSSQIGVK